MIVKTKMCTGKNLNNVSTYEEGCDIPWPFNRSTSSPPAGNQPCSLCNSAAATVPFPPALSTPPPPPAGTNRRRGAEGCCVNIRNSAGAKEARDKLLVSSSDSCFNLSICQTVFLDKNKKQTAPLK